MHKPVPLIVTIILMGLLVACGSGAPTATPTSPPPTATMVPSTATMSLPAEMAPPTATAQGAIGGGAAKQQVAAGQQIYTTECERCHGADLQGKIGPALTESTLSTYGSAQDLMEYISTQMPQGAPASLTSAQYYEVTAFLLQRAGLLPAGVVLAPDNTAKILLTKSQTTGPTGTAVPPGTLTAQQLTVVKVARIPTVGEILTNGQGFTLYHNINDAPDVSTCTGACTDLWPPLTVPQGVQPVAAPGTPGKLGVFERPDGTYQVTYTDLPTYNQVPLYTYSADTEPGDRGGDSLYGIWYSVTLPPSATPIATSSPAAGQGNAALGALTYMVNCTPCHGVEGEGIDAPPLRDSHYVQTAGDQAISATIANGRPGTEMPAWLQANGGPLTDAQIANVIAYLHTLQGVSPLPTATPVPEEPTATPLPPGAPTPEPARPSEPGGPGPAASMTGNVARGQSEFGLYCASCHGPEGVQGIPNPGSDDGSVPVLNPIDPTIANPDPKIFAANVDLFIQHGSLPSGPGPLIMMPSFGDSKLLTQQQIVDLIAYVMSLNAVKAPASASP